MSQQDSVQRVIECSVRIIPVICALPAEQPVQICLMSSAGELRNVHGIQPPESEALLETVQFKEYSVLTDSDYVWEVEDDSGEYAAVPPEVDDKIKTAYRQACASGMLLKVGGFSHEGKQYTVNFDFSQITEGNSRSYPLRQRPPFWCYKGPETGFIRHEDNDSASIEEVYRYGGSHAVMGGTKYTFMFSESGSHQVDTNTDEMVAIVRYPPVDSKLLEVNVRISLQGDLASVETVKSQILQLCNRCPIRKFSNTFPADEKTQHIVSHQIANAARSYCVSAKHELANNQITTTLQGEEGYVEMVGVILRSRIEAELHKYVASLSAEPRWWALQTQDRELKPVFKGSAEWNDVLRRMRRTLPKAEMVQLERIQNQPLWEKFAIERKQMYKRNNGEINEKHLFHGSRKVNPRDIVLSLTGVDFRYSRDQNLMWGTGAYFAVNASYSDTFAHQMRNNLKQMILVQVLTGKSCSYGKTHNKALTKPPQLPRPSLPSASAGPAPLYDTVNGETNGSTVYVVYNHDKSYPAYIITYKSSVAVPQIVGLQFPSTIGGFRVRKARPGVGN